jgi:hypothetical protein
MRPPDPRHLQASALPARAAKSPLGAEAIVFGSLMLVVVGLMAGCGRSGPDVQFVEGIVRLDGTPIANAVVDFRPLQETSLAATGSTDASGRYRLTSTRGGKRGGGALVGDYAVTISKWRNRMEDIPEPDPSDTAARTEWDRKVRAIGDLPPDYIVPKRYGDHSTSGLTATVKPGRNTGPAFTFELTSAGAPP